MGNVQSLSNKIDKIGVLMRAQLWYQQCVKCVTEKWLQEHIPDSNYSLPSFQRMRTDRDGMQSCKSKGSEIVVLVKSKWCRTTVKQHLSSQVNWFLTTSKLLLKEFTSVILVAVAKIQTQHPSAASYIAPLVKIKLKICSIQTWERYIQLPCSTCFRSADHNLAFLSSIYKLIVQRQPVTKRTVRSWSQEAEETLRGCFEATDWDAFCEPHGDDISAMTECYWLC